MSEILTPADLPKHRYLKKAKPGFRSTMQAITNLGGPWYCESCETASLLVYRCSCCGGNLLEENNVRRDR